MDKETYFFYTTSLNVPRLQYVHSVSIKCFAEDSRLLRRSSLNFPLLYGPSLRELFPCCGIKILSSWWAFCHTWLTGPFNPKNDADPQWKVSRWWYLFPEAARWMDYNHRNVKTWILAPKSIGSSTQKKENGCTCFVEFLMLSKTDLKQCWHFLTLEIRLVFWSEFRLFLLNGQKQTMWVLWCLFRNSKRPG